MNSVMAKVEAHYRASLEQWRKLYPGLPESAFTAAFTAGVQTIANVVSEVRG